MLYHTKPFVDFDPTLPTLKSINDIYKRSYNVLVKFNYMDDEKVKMLLYVINK